MLGTKEQKLILRGMIYPLAQLRAATVPVEFLPRHPFGGGITLTVNRFSVRSCRNAE
jgi:hypothetical protein